MALKKDIEILELNIKEVGNKMPPDTLHALKMGVEAMKYVEEIRHPPYTDSGKRLPGETEE